VNVWTTDRLAGAGLALFSLGVIWENRKLPMGTLREPGPGYMPLLLALLLLFFSILIFAAGGAPRMQTLIWTEWRHAVAILGVCFFAGLALERLGFRLTIVVALAFLLKVVERKGWVATAAFALGMAFGTFFLFETVLRVPLPRGPFGL
jgi:putative tricarboxylic transport membrane protein